MKNPNFENAFYLSIWKYLIDIHGQNSISFNKEINTIKVELSNVRYFLTISYNENKIYFQNNDPEINEKLSYEDYKKLDKSFRVFRFEEAKKYIDFKSKENKFISEIQG